MLSTERTETMNTESLIQQAQQDSAGSIFGCANTEANGRHILCTVQRTSGQVAKPVWRADFRIDGKRAKRTEVEAILA